MPLTEDTLYRKAIDGLAVVPLLLFTSFSLIAEPVPSLSELKEKAASALSLGRLPEAVELYRQWTEREPGRSEAYLGLGRSLLEMGYADRARAAFLRAQQLRPDLHEAKVGLAETYLRKGQAGQAYELLDEVRKRDPSNVQLNLSLASYYRMMGRNDLRRGYLEKALRQNPALLPAVLELAVLAAEEGKISESEQHLERAALISPDAVSLMKKRAEIHYRLFYTGYGRPQLEKARHYYRMYLHAAGDDPSVVADLIHIEYLLGHAKEARALAERIDRSDMERRPVLHANIAEAMLPEGPVSKFVEPLQIACEQSMLPLSCFRLEQAIIRNDRNRSFQLQRLQRMKARLNDAKSRLARNRIDAEELHLTRAMELYPEDLSLRKQMLERYRRAGAYEDYLQTLIYLRDREPGEPRWNTRLQEALRSRREYLPYRIGLEEYQRKPQKILIFDLRPDRNSMEHYREPALVADFLIDAVRFSARWQAVEEEVRSGLRRRLPQESSFLFYDSSVPDRLTDMGVQELDAMLEGSYDLRPSSLRLRLTLRNRDGILLGSFRDDASPSDEDLLATKVLAFLDRSIPLQATLIDVKHLIVNAGTADGLKKEELLRADRSGDVILKVEETSRYVSRVSVISGRIDQLSLNMRLTRVVRK